MDLLNLQQMYSLLTDQPLSGSYLLLELLYNERTTFQSLHKNQVRNKITNCYR